MQNELTGITPYPYRKAPVTDSRAYYAQSGTDSIPFHNRTPYRSGLYGKYRITGNMAVTKSCMPLSVKGLETCREMKQSSNGGMYFEKKQRS